MFDVVKLAVKFDMLKHSVTAAAADRKGVTALEYGVIAAAIIAVCIAAFNTLGSSLNGMLGNLASDIAQ